MDRQYLITSIHPRDLRKSLHESKAGSRALAGFQDRAESLKQPLVIDRIAQLMDTDSTFREGICELWRAANEELVAAIKASAGKLKPQLPELAKRFGRQAVHCALELDERKGVRDLAKQVQHLEMPDHSGESQSETRPEHREASGAPGPADREGHKEAAKRDRVRLHELAKQVEQLRGNLARTGKARERAAEELAQLNDQTRKLEKKLHDAGRLTERLRKAWVESQAELKLLRKQKRPAATPGPAPAGDDSGCQAIRQALTEGDWGSAQRGCAQLLESAAALQQRVRELLLEMAAAQAAQTAAGPRPVPTEPVLTWSADGTQHRYTAEQIAEALRRNEEPPISRLRAMAKTISAKDREHWREALVRADPSLDWPAFLARATKAVIVDGSNVARHGSRESNHGKLAQLLAARRTLYACGYFPVLIYVDASLTRCIDQPNELTALCDRGEVEMVPAGVEADEWIILEARERGCSVVTNDHMLDRDPDDEVAKCGFDFRGKDFVLKA